jgi:ATP-dependent Clp protease ATP-binding subunit ClpA
LEEVEEIESERFTEKANGVLLSAWYYSSPRGPSPVEPEHILLALLLVDPELFRLLAPTGKDQIEDIRSDLKAFNPRRRKSWRGQKPPLSSSSTEVIALAESWSRSLACDRIGTEHLLLGLIESRTSGLSEEKLPSRVSNILTSRGFSAERVEAQARAGTIIQRATQSKCELVRGGPGPHSHNSGS